MYKPPAVFTIHSTWEGTIQRMMSGSHSEVREGSHRQRSCLFCSEEFPDSGTTREQNSLVKGVVNFIQWIFKNRWEHKKPANKTQTQTRAPVSGEASVCMALGMACMNFSGSSCLWHKVGTLLYSYVLIYLKVKEVKFWRILCPSEQRNPSLSWSWLLGSISWQLNIF